MAPARPAIIGDGFPEVLAAAKANAAWAFTRFYEALAPKVAGYFRLQGVADPDDLTSEVFLSAFSSIGDFTGNEDQFRSWLFTIAHRRLTDERRRQSRRPLVADGVEAEFEGRAVVDDVEREVLSRLSLERVQLLCDRLVPDQRDVLLLRLVGAMTVEEAALALDKSPGAVKALQRRGLSAIKKILLREGVPL